METNHVTNHRGLKVVRTYGIVVLFALFLMNTATLGVLHWVESNDIRDELARYANTLPAPDINKPDQTINLPEDIVVLRTNESNRIGFYETSIGGQDYLVYSDPNTHYVLMKSEAGVQKETQSFAIALGALYLGEITLLLGWWFFIRAKVREIFEIA